ncbi:phosphotransferase family protein [Streptomyces scopuliridis]|uniref:phosphotransferase family protein n=1 Tax=Streptomyces scopuliridis TaxID=452529 RepID=UPI0036B299D4
MAAAHTSAAATLGATVTGRPVWGWYGRTLGHSVHHPVHGACWLRLLSASSGDEGGKLWEGNELAARLIPGVHRPPLYAVRDWVRDGFAYRAELSGFVADPVLSPSPVVSGELDLTDAWLKSIRGDLNTIAGTATDRVAVRQQWIDRAVPMYTGRPAPQITDWECAHGDFHAANITRSGIILDWEGFGLAPRGWDVAVFLAYTQLAPRTADRVRVEFADLFESDTAGRVALLVACADLLQSASRGDHPELVPALRSLVEWCAPA